MIDFVNHKIANGLLPRKDFSYKLVTLPPPPRFSPPPESLSHPLAPARRTSAAGDWRCRYLCKAPARLDRLRLLWERARDFRTRPRRSRRGLWHCRRQNNFMVSCSPKCECDQIQQYSQYRIIHTSKSFLSHRVCFITGRHQEIRSFFRKIFIDFECHETISSGNDTVRSRASSAAYPKAASMSSGVSDG